MTGFFHRIEAAHRVKHLCPRVDEGIDGAANGCHEGDGSARLLSPVPPIIFNCRLIVWSQPGLI